ncbi:MAG: single-stranded DNA-binding protein [Gammaproteobacteria bacterium]
MLISRDCASLPRPVGRSRRRHDAQPRQRKPLRPGVRQSGPRGDQVTWVSVAVFEEKARGLEGLAKGTEVYAEGRLSLNAWTSRDGAERTGLAVTAWRIEVLGQIGGRPGRAKARRERAEAAPFDDAIPF